MVAPSIQSVQITNLKIHIPIPNIAIFFGRFQENDINKLLSIVKGVYNNFIK